MHVFTLCVVTGARIKLNTSSVNVNEGDTFQLCVLVNDNAAECGVAYDFDVSLTVSASSPGTASYYTSVSHTLSHIIIYLHRVKGRFRGL